jgi:phage terminase large subunit GpA-like protein
VPCPCCSVYIELKWSVEGPSGIVGGITWKVNDKGELLPETVGYTCQECGGFFTDQNKSDFVNRGYWQPTAKPFRPDFFSYHMSSLYSPHGMSDWTYYVYKWLEAHPEGGSRNESKYQTFLNVNLGEPYEQQGASPAANELQKNIRNYEIGMVPEKLSQRDGNGRIVLLTCACDLNGVEDDARLDYEIVGWSENGASYSIMHGSIGTFVPRENTMKIKEDRERWTYLHGKPNSVWPKLRDILGAKIQTDTGRNMKIFVVGVDCGHYTNHAYHFIDKPNVPGMLVLGLKGDKEGKYTKFGVDMPPFRPARERTGLYLVEVNQVKDDMAACIKLSWDQHNDRSQPPGFMNYPTPTGGLYLFNNYFSHYEAEHRIIESKEGEGIAARWVKKTSAHQNHFFDVRVYNMAVRDILVSLVCKELKMKTYGWTDYVDIVLGKIKK